LAVVAVVLACALIVKCSIRAAKKTTGGDDLESDAASAAATLSAVAGSAQDTARAMGNSAPSIAPLLNILTGYVQVMGQLGSVLTVPIPDGFANFLGVLNFVSLPIGQFVNSQCVSWQLGSDSYTSSYSADFAIKAAMPFGIVLGVLAVYGVARAIVARMAPAKIKAKVIKAARAYAAGGIIFLLNFFHPAVTSTMFRVYLCEEIYLDRPEAQRWLIADHATECDGANPGWTGKIAVSVVITLLYTIGWPLFLFVNLLRWHRRPYRNARGEDMPMLTKQVSADHGLVAGFNQGKPVYSFIEIPMTRLDNEEARQLLGSSYGDYEDRWFWFSVYETLRRTVQTAGVVVVSFIAGPEQSKDFELPFITFIAWLSLAFAALTLPFKNYEDDKVMLLALLVVAVTMTGLQADQLADFGQGGHFGSFLVAIQVILLAVIVLFLMPRLLKTFLNALKNDQVVGKARSLSMKALLASSSKKRIAAKKATRALSLTTTAQILPHAPDGVAPLAAPEAVPKGVEQNGAHAQPPPDESTPRDAVSPIKGEEVLPLHDA